MQELCRELKYSHVLDPDVSHPHPMLIRTTTFNRLKLQVCSMKIGAKTSVHPERWEMIKELVRIVDFIEVYYTDERISLAELKKLETRWVVHGPHIAHGVDFTKLTKEGKDVFKKSIVLANDLEAKYVIVHPGSFEEGKKGNMFGEMIRNILLVKDFASDNGVSLIIENLYYFDTWPVELGISTKPYHWFGHTPEEIKKITKATRTDFLMDFAHAFLTSKSLGIDYKKIMNEFAALKSQMFHICDGTLASDKDEHLPLGKGEYDLPFFASLIGNKDVTLEVASGKYPTLEDFVESVNYLNKLGAKRTK